jgi:gliding motility-associated-like protein
MNKGTIFTIISLLIVVQAFPQMYILNEDFSGASGTTPPPGWNNIVITGTANDKWHFDNPGDRILNYPFTEPFAIFDSDSTSNDGQPEEVSLESSMFDASTSNYVLLQFMNVFNPGTGGSASIEAYDGSAWNNVFNLSVSTPVPTTEIVDLSAVTGGITNGRLRFTWSGNGSGFWAVDNIRIYASLPLDGGVVSIDNPHSPVTPGSQQVQITLGNFGYSNLASTTIKWTADGIQQPDFNWNGSIGFGQTQSNIVIGSYNFQDPVEVVVWQIQPNGQNDLNPYNDTVSEYLVTPLCGNYTIGGTNPDFESFTQVAEVLNVAGVTCPVIFNVRNGTYYEEFELREIPGVSAVNTITFRSESGDSTLTLLKIIPNALKYETLLYMNGAQYVTFENIGFSTGSGVSYANNALVLDGSKNISLKGCYFMAANQFDASVVINGGSENIEIENSYFESYSARATAINISDSPTRSIDIQGNYFEGATDWGYATIRVANYARKVNIQGNHLERCFRAVYLDKADSVSVKTNMVNNTNEGVYVDPLCTHIEISSNRLTNIKSHQDVQEGTSGIFVKSSSSIDIINNFVHTTTDSPVMGISLQDVSSGRVCFNSVNIANTDKKGESKGLLLTGTNSISAKNNIFNVLHSGTPVYLDGGLAGLDFDRNDYYSSNERIGFYNDIFYTDLTAWKSAVGMDDNSLSCIPFYTSETDLSINQALLNNIGVPVSGITADIDGTLRNPANPDIGAKEYDKCAVDAGINAILSPQNPLAGGPQQVTVQLQNQGTSALTGVRINWSVNDVLQPNQPWSGNLAEGANIGVSLGNYDFQSGILYTIKAWTSEPNNIADCDTHNDTITSHELAVPLCGNYTIGGSGPDFNTIDDAITLLNLAGVTCPVNFLIRDGIYFEKIVIKSVAGASATNIVTFESESHDSTKVTLQILQNAAKFETMLYLDGSSYIIFKDLGLFTGTSLNYANNAVMMSGAGNISFENCNFSVKKESDLGVGIGANCHSIAIDRCRFESLNVKAMAIQASGSPARDISITGNYIKGATEWGFATVKISNEVRSVNISGNTLENCFQAIYFINSDSALISKNIIRNCNEGIYIDNYCNDIEISGNRFSDIKSHENAPEGTSAIYAYNASLLSIINNYIHTSGNGPVIGITLQNTSQSKILFNSLNITNQDLQNKSKGVFLKTSTSIQARNNILKMKYSAVPVYISSTPLQVDFDYNDYISNNGSIGYLNGTTYSDLPSWRTATGQDLHSLSVPPFFNSETDLGINQVLLNNAGIPVTGVIDDIDGTLRNPATPDIGAKEYDPCDPDAGINAFTSPVPPLTGGVADVKVILQNQGTGALTSAKIDWQVNGITQPQYSWSGNLAAAANIEVLLGSYDFQGGSAFSLKAWTSLPDNSADCNNLNDTTTSRELSGPLCGTYTVGGTDGDFATLSQVAEVLNSAGITCPVEFLIRDGLYYDKFILRQIAGSSADNTITFRSESQDSSKVTVKIEPDAVNYEPMALLDGTQYVVFRQLGLFTGTTSGIANYALQLDGAKNIGIDRCHFEIRNESDYGINVIDGSQDVTVTGSRFDCINSKAGAINIAGAQTSGITLSGNYINGSTGWGNTLVKVGNNAENIDIENNTFDRSFRALYCIGADSVTISKNIIRNSNSGIYIDNLCSVIDIESNRLINIQSSQNVPDGTSGIITLNSSDIDIVNNFIETGGIGPVLGINLQNTTSCRTYYNSVNITNTDAQGKSRGFYLKTVDTLQVRDNIFNIKASGVPIHLDVNVTHYNLDYNNYYNPAGIIGRVNNQNYSDLFTWGQTVVGDANSKAVNPYFKADTLPLPYQRILNGSGIPIPGVTYDMDGKLRHNQAPDIGCVEFFVDYGILELLSPDLNCYQPDVDSVKVYLRQYGDVPFDVLKIAYQLDNGTIHIDTIPGPLISDLVHTFATIETISAPGEYHFKIWLINTLDDNINNDTLRATRYSKPPPVISIQYDNMCTGWEVHFTGNATIEDPYYVEKYEWLFGDGDTSILQNPVHVYAEAGTYEVTLRAYSNAGCYSEEFVPVTITADFQGLQLEYTLVNESCMGDGTGSLELFPSGGTPPYTFFLNGTEVSSNPITNFKPGQYEIKTVDSQNCYRIDSVESYTMAAMHPQIIADPLSGYTPLTVQFDFTADSAASWVWHFSEAETDTNKLTSHTFIEYGEHEVILGVNSGPPYYCTETTTITIFVDIIITIDANTVFTPNGDSINDYFEVKSVGLKDMDVKFFNQWGNKVYETTEMDGRWDGMTSDGAKAPDGTYFWSLKATGVNDLEYDRKGSVLLLRHGAAAYPNPVTDRVKLEPYEMLDSPVTVSVYSVFGQLAYTEIIENTGNINIDLSQLPGGIYILKASDGKNDCYARIIKK